HRDPGRQRPGLPDRAGARPGRRRERPAGARRVWPGREHSRRPAAPARGPEGATAEAEVNCQALRADGSPCPHAAIHQHVTQQGTRVMVCGTHLRMLKKRERLNSDEEKLQEWGITPEPTPSPGQTTPVGE